MSSKSHCLDRFPGRLKNVFPVCAVKKEVLQSAIEKVSGRDVNQVFPWDFLSESLINKVHIDRFLEIKYIRIILNTLLLEEIWQNQRDTPGSAGSVWHAEAV